MAYSSRLEIQIDSRTGERNVRSLRSELAGLDRAGDRAAGTVGRASRQVDGLGAVSRSARVAVASLAGALGAREIVGYSDAWTSATNRVRTYTESAEQLTMVQSELVRTALETRSNFEATADLYATFARSNDELGLSQEKIIELTGTINKSFALSGVEAAAAAGAIRQLGQGLASGALRGDEFNSVAEQAPDIMRAIANSLGMATGDLREFAATGGITAEIIVDALTEAREEIDGNFSRSMATFSQDLENARTNIIRFVGESETITEATSALGSVIVGLSESLDTLVDVGVLAAGIFGARAISSMGSYAAATVQAQLASVSLSAATAQKAATELSWLRSVQASLSAQLASATSTTQMIALRRQLAANTAALTAANSSYTTSLAASTVAARAGTAALAGLRGAMAFVGGPVGVALLAAGSLYYFRDSLFDVRSEATETEKSVKALADRMQGLTRAQLEHERTNLSRQMRENAAEIADAREEYERLQEKQSQSSARSASGIGSVGVLADMGKVGARIGQLTREGETLQSALSDVEREMERLGTTARKTQQQLDAEEMGSLAESVRKIRDQVDPLGAEFATLNTQINALMRASALGIISPETRDKLITGLVEAMADAGEDAGKESAEAFINPWQSAADSVAQSLQDAIASGDWDSIGDAIGGALGSSIAAIVNKQVTDSLAKSITADSGMFAQIGAAFAGPIAGAVAGGVAQLAIAEVSDWLSSSDWDPTEARQAAQGTRTILGDMDAKSESIRRAVEGSESGIGQLVGINQGMLIALRQLQAGISGASTMIARGQGDINFSPENTYSQTDQAFQGFGVLNAGAMIGSLGSAYGISAALGPVGQLLNNALGGIIEDGVTFLDDLTGGLLSDVGSSVFGGDRDVKDVGIEFFGATLDEMIRGWRDGDNLYTAQAYASIEEDGGWFGSDSNWDEYQRLGTEAEQQIGLVFSKIQSSVTAGAEILGMSGGEINDALSRFRVESQKISLEDLSADQQAAELEAVFSSIFDQASGAVVPYLDEFQRAGEGLGETLARVANQTLVTQEAVNRLGIRFSDLAGRELVVASERLMDAAGGVEQFITSMQGFIGNFASDAQKFELAYSDINRALAQSNLQLPSTRDGYYDLLQAQNGATASGAENIATLLRLQGVADDYYTFLEDAQSEALKAEEEMQRERLSLSRELLQIQRSAISESLREAEAASGAVGRALAGLTVQSSSFARLSRDAALASLQGMAASGRIGDQGQLDRALSAATNIQAGEFSTMNDYIRGVSRTGETLRDLKWVADQQLTREQRSLANIERQMEAMNEEISAVGRATAKHTAKTAKILERFEVEGLEVRE